MLKTLSIWNFALIEHLEIDFSSGLNILTGETGAGKSILIGAISLVTGAKASAEMIRNGADFLRVEAVFSINYNSALRRFLEQEDILLEDDEIIIIRQFNRSGRSNIKVNGCNISLSNLKVLGALLVDIHSQHANQELLLEKRQLSYLDKLNQEALGPLLRNYQETYSSWKEAVNQLETMMEKSQNISERTDLLNWQIQEISEANLRLNEDVELESQVKLLSNAEKIAEATQLICDIFNGDEMHEGLTTSISTLIDEFSKLASYDDNMQSHVDILNEIYYQLQDISSEINNYHEDIEYSPHNLDTMQARLHELDRLKTKYGTSIADILAYYETISTELATLDNFEDTIAELNERITKLHSQMHQKALVLHEKRQQLGEIIAHNIVLELQDLGMKNARLELNYELTDKYTNLGADNLSILFSANLGEQLRPLHKIVSGGELSRISLALKTITAKYEEINLLILDEIDTGVGGQTANMLADKIALIAHFRQVICITHLPQIAAMADEHFYIRKYTANEQTFTSINRLDSSKQIEEIARMASGKGITEAATNNAKEMLKFAHKTKKSLSMLNRF